MWVVGVGKWEEKITEKMIGAEVVLAAGSEQSAKSSSEGSHPAALISAGQVKSKCVG